MKAYSYVVPRDYGFAPNPFYGYCTLGTCKPEIRKAAAVGDWVLGCGSARHRASGLLVFVMHVDEKVHFNTYWSTQRFQCKKPVMNGSLKQMYGDNIYHFDNLQNKWLQADSHHSLEDGSENEVNKIRDLRSEYVLVSRHFWYFGGRPIEIPPAFRDTGLDICCTRRGHKVIRTEDLILRFVNWLKAEPSGYRADPREFGSFRRYKGAQRK